MTYSRHKGKPATMRALTRTLCLFCLGLFSGHAFAAGYQTHDSIYAAVRQFMAEHTRAVYNQPAEIEPGKMDSRLTLSQCSKPLEVSLPKGGRDLGRITVSVKCTDARPWSLQVPTTVTMYKDIIVAASSLPRGTILSADDFSRVKHDVSSLPNGYIADEQSGVGMELRRHLSAGTPLTTSMIRKPEIIRRGQQVVIIAVAGNLEVRMSGKALAHGGVGDRIRVLNLSSKQKVEGTILPSGDIRVDL